MKTIRTKVDESQNGTRLDLALSALQPHLSRRKIRMIIDLGGVYLNRRRIRVASRPVQSGDTLEVIYNESNLTRQKLESTFNLGTRDILFDDHGIIAINKPAGLPSQATRDQAIENAERSLNKFLQNEGKGRRATLLHRLDKETSGVLLFGTDPKVTEEVSLLFKERGLEKQYLAICYGFPREYEFEYSCDLSEIDPRLGFVRRLKKGTGKYSHTSFKLLSFHKRLNLSLIECRPTTGRSHQIRIHLDILENPIVGDKRYGRSHDRTLPRQLTTLANDHHFLHAHSIEFGLESGARIKIEALPPRTFRDFCKAAELSW